MTPTHSIRRALMSGLILAVVGCDVVQFASDPKPRLVETWNMPASNSAISVAKFLPSGVSIYSTPATTPPDSIGFTVTIASVGISQVLGTASSGCTACVPLNGTNAIKPAFILNANNATALPSNVVSAAILSGQVALSVTNNLTFDPLYVKTGAGSQGFMVITIKSGTAVLGADTVTGAATNTLVGGKLVSGPFAPGTTLPRTINLTTGTVTGNVTADVVFDSPVGDHLVPINVNSTVNATFGIPTLVVGNVRINVPLTNITPSAPTDLPKGLDPGITDHVVSGALEMAITNPFAVSGTLSAQFKYGPLATDTVLRTFALPAATTTPQVRTVAFDSAAMVKIFKGDPTVLTMTGGVSSTAPLTVTPKQQVVITNRLILGVRLGGGS
jgi:hypothetical protein